jgi:hypothetical protein
MHPGCAAICELCGRETVANARSITAGTWSTRGRTSSSLKGSVVIRLLLRQPPQSGHEKHVAELQKMSAAQVAAVNRLNTSTTFLSVMAIVCTVILGVISLATSCRVSLITPPPNIALQRTPGVGAPDAAVPVRRGDGWLTEQRVDFDTGG